MKKERLNISHTSWAESEFGIIDFGDKRLSKRLLKIADSCAESPESPINQACEDWHQTKAAYRFFQNNAVDQDKILAHHTTKTVERAQKYPIILAIQDTSYISYKNHHKTKGLGPITAHPSSQTSPTTPGLVMHTTLAVTTQGVPIGLLDQKINARPTLDKTVEGLSKRDINSLPIEEKESNRWIESLEKLNDYAGLKNTQVVTICDREADIYDLLKAACASQSAFVIRAYQDRKVNKQSLHCKTSGDKLSELLDCSPCQGKIKLQIAARDNQPSRTADLEVRLVSFIMNPPKKNIKNKTEKLPDLSLKAIYVLEKNPPLEQEPMKWILLTNMPVNNFEQAEEKIKWYCLRWKIEIFHKVLKSGFKVEACRLGSADRLIRFLTIMSVIAWRIFYVTLMAREDPNLPCVSLLAEEEWKVLYSKIHRSKDYPDTPPTIREAVRWIAQLGGFLGRKGDGEPGPITLWRGWKRLVDLAEGWNLALV